MAPHRISAFILIISALLAPAQDDAGEDPALQQYFVANGAYNRKLYPVAIQQFSEFLEKHSKHPKADLARRGLALSYYASKKYKEAVPPLTALLASKTLDKSISRERLVMMLGQCLVVTGEKDKAKALYVAELVNLETAAYQTSALASICDVSFGAAAWDEVLAWTAKLLASKPDATQAARGLYQQGYAHYQLKDPEAAIVSLGRIEALEAGKVWTTRSAYLLGECYSRQKKYESAGKAFAAALPGLTGADAIECRFRLGLTRFVLGNYEEAEADLGAYLGAAADGAHAAEARLYMARSLLERGQYKKAGTALTALSQGKGETAARASLWLARVYTRHKDKDYDSAATVLGKACKAYAKSVLIDDLRFDYANALMARSEPDWKTALATLELVRAGGKFSQMAEVLSQEAVCLQKLEDYEKSLAANEAFLTSYAGHPLAAEARFMKAENLFLLRKLDDAMEAYSEFLMAHEAHPSRVAAAFRIAQIHHAAGRWEKCLASAAPLLAGKPAGPLYAQLPFLVGDCHFRLENWDDAIGPLGEFLAPWMRKGEDGAVAVKAGSNVDTALIQLAVACDRTGQKDKALAYFQTVATGYPGPTPQLPLTLAELGRLAYESGKLPQARKALERFVASDTADDAIFAKHAPAQRARVKYYLGWIEAAEKDYPAAAARFGEVLALDPNHPLAADAALQLGIALFNAGDYAAASKHFAAVLESYPKHEKLARVVFHAGLALARQKQWDPAAVHFKRVVTAFPKSEFADRALYEWAWCERGAGRMAQATELYEQLLADHPGSTLAVKVNSELAELNVDSAAQDKIIATLTATLETLKDASLREEIRYQLASAHFKKADYKTAAAQFKVLLKEYPKSKLLASMHFHAGEAGLQLGQFESARDHFEAAGAIPGSPADLMESITMRLGETQALSGQHTSAGKTYASFLEKFPGSRWTRNARFGLALATEMGGNPKAALPEYKKLSGGPAVDLWTVRSRFQTGTCYAALKQYDHAVVEFVNVEISYPQYPEWQAKAILEIGRVLLAQNKAGPAEERFKEVIRRFEKEEAAAMARKMLGELAKQ